MRCRILILALLFLTTLNAQDRQRLRESVLKLKTASEDTNKVMLLNDIGWDTSYDNLSVGLKFCNEAIELARKLKFNRGIMLASNSLGTIYSDLGDYNKALACHQESISTAETEGNLYSQGTSFMNLFLVYKAMDEPLKAHTCLLRSKAIYTALKSIRGICVVNNNLGSSYITLDSLGKAMVAFQIADSLADQMGKPEYKAHALSGLSSCYLSMEDSSKAYSYLRMSIHILDSLKDNYDLAQAYNDMGLLYTHFKEYDKAEKEYMKAFKLFRMIGMIDQEKQIWMNLADLYEVRNEPAKALSALKRYHEMKDSIIGEKVLRHQQELEALYENEKKESRITKLTQERKFQGTVVTALVAGVLLLFVLLFVLFNRNKLRKRTNQQLAGQNAIIEEKNKNITDSINYARRIQDAVLPSPNILHGFFSDAFIFYRPRDIVSGDFWWFIEKKGKFFLAVADSTGHGVPGGFMSVMGAAFLSEIVNEKEVTDPADILNALREKVIGALVHAGDDSKSIRDGMDMGMCVFDLKSSTLEFAGANNPLWMVRDGMLYETDADNFPVGIHEGAIKPFTNKMITLKKNDMLYLFTDGYADQFGGTDGKKYKYRKLKELVVKMAAKNSEEQERITQSEFENWKGELEQVDDVLMVGIKI